MMALYEFGGHKVVTPGEGRYFVAENATVLGRVVLGEDVSVWFNAVIRGDNEPIVVGARSSIQEGCVLHTDPGFPLTIGEEATIGHGCVLHGCTLGRRVLIGIGAIVLNGARIGDGTIIGAGALIPEGREIPADSVVLGSPGKVARPVSDADRERVAWGVDDYVQRWKRYVRGLKPQRA
jgi:carbonic anhydrase/acetyltransferase-like protein (isoleucine patch superfamily)